jgi:hypothetical protein
LVLPDLVYTSGVMKCQFCGQTIPDDTLVQMGTSDSEVYCVPDSELKNKVSCLTGERMLRVVKAVLETI